MTLRPLLAAIALVAAPAALAASVAPPQPSSESATSGSATAQRAGQPSRRDRMRSTPLKPRVIEAPGAAVMMIPAAFDPTQNGPFNRF